MQVKVDRQLPAGFRMHAEDAPGSLIPASAGQRLVWALELAKGNDGALNVVQMFRIHGTLDTDLFACCLREVISRHGALRTTFVSEGLRLMQNVNDPEHLDLSATIRLSSLAGSVDGRTDVVSHIARIRAEESRYRFDLRREIPIRVRIDCLTPTDHLLTINCHHIATDGWSGEVIIDDLWGLYAWHQGKRAAPPDVPAWQYADFTQWQLERDRDGSAAKDIAYWARVLPGALPAGLPGALGTPAGPPVESGMVHRFRAPDGLREMLDQGCKTYRVTRFEMLLALLVSYYCAFDAPADLVLPVMYANRAVPQLKRTVGYVANLLLLRVDTSGEAGFAEIVRRAARAARDALLHQGVPYHLVPAQRVPGQPPRRPPVVLFEYWDASGRAQDFSGLEVQRLPETGLRSARFDFECHFIREGDDLTLECYTSAQSRISAESMSAFWSQFAQTASSALSTALVEDLGRGGRLPG